MAYEVYKWIEETRTCHLTLGEIRQMTVGQTLAVLLLDLNFEEYYIWKNIPADTPLPPQQFFKANKVTLTYQGKLTWDIGFAHGETVRHPVHVCTESLATNWRWCAVEDGLLSLPRAEMLRDDIGNGRKGKETISVAALPDLTRVGWRGPMLHWDSLQQLPDVFWRE